MKFFSTARVSPSVDLRGAVLNSLPPDNGLYLPENINPLKAGFAEGLSGMSIQEIGFEVSKTLLTDSISASALQDLIETAITFDAPLTQLDQNTAVLELFHGPTLAFKDFGARFMARLVASFVASENNERTILVATSGDTGSAVAQGFAGVEGVRVVLLYPEGKVSNIQEKQLTVTDSNCKAFRVRGTFDDCQKMVKEAFLSKELSKKHGLTSANSINIGRLIPQSFYYFRAFGQLRSTETGVIISVPSGNFGNLTAGLIAKKMGLPVDRFVAASNANRVFTDYYSSGEYTPRDSVLTFSNAMDVGRPSNLARIRELYQEDISKLRAEMFADTVSDKKTLNTIARVKSEYNYLLDPHAAVGYTALRVLPDSLINAQKIVLATAHPAKFPEAIAEALDGYEVPLPAGLQKYLDAKGSSVAIEPSLDALREQL